MRLSVSQMTTLHRCPREWFFQKVMALPQPKSKALMLGSAFHECLDGNIDTAFDELEAYDPDTPWRAMIGKMLEGYKAKWPKELTEIQREIPIGDGETFLGFIDGVAINDLGNWYLIENKSASSDIDSMDALTSNLQVAVYEKYMLEVADKLLLDPGLYAGMLYCVTVKPGERRKTKETMEQYGERMTSETHIYLIEPNVSRVDVGHEILTALITAEPLLTATDPKHARGNPSACIRFNSPCPYFARCHLPGGVTKL
jgi:hypothetical protein